MRNFSAHFVNCCCAPRQCQSLLKFCLLKKVEVKTRLLLPLSMIMMLIMNICCCWCSCCWCCFCFLLPGRRVHSTAYKSATTTDAWDATADIEKLQRKRKTRRAVFNGHPKISPTYPHTDTPSPLHPAHYFCPPSITNNQPDHSP